MAAQRKMTFGIVVGNRGFFPGHLAKTGREEIIAVLEAVGDKAIVLSPEESRHGAVETYAESQRCADLFKKHAEEIDGIIVTLPNFGEERGIVDAIRLSGLKVPVLVQATPDSSDNMTIAVRRDSFCGKMSACNNMMQYGINYSLTTLHTEAVSSPEFKADLEWFSQVCRIVKGLKNLKIGAIGARPSAFNTVRYSERILETNGISIEPIDLSEIFGRINRMKDNDDAAQAKLAAIKKYVTTAGIPEAALLKMAKLGAVVDGWMKQTNCTISAVQCWTSMEEFFGVVPCTIMSMMSNELIPSACEVDVPGTLSMYMLALASRHAFGAARLEQQLRRRSQQVRLLPLLQPAQALLQGSEDGLPADHRGHRRQGKHLRHLRGCHQARRNVLCALLHRRPAWRRPWLHGRRPIHRRSLGNLWRRGCGRNSAVAEAAQVHLPRGIRAPRCRELQ
jgi:L-fucose isomerase-like protein